MSKKADIKYICWMLMFLASVFGLGSVCAAGEGTYEAFKLLFQYTDTCTKLGKAKIKEYEQKNEKN